MFLENLFDVVLNFFYFLLNFGLGLFFLSFLGFLEIKHFAFHQGIELFEYDLNKERGTFLLVSRFILDMELWSSS